MVENRSNNFPSRPHELFKLLLNGKIFGMSYFVTNAHKHQNVYTLFAFGSLPVFLFLPVSFNWEKVKWNEQTKQKGRKAPKKKQNNKRNKKITREAKEIRHFLFVASFSFSSCSKVHFQSFSLDFIWNWWLYKRTLNARSHTTICSTVNANANAKRENEEEKCSH